MLVVEVFVSVDIASARAVMNDPRPAWELSIDVSAFVTANVTPCDDDLDTEYPKLAPPTVIHFN